MNPIVELCAKVCEELYRGGIHRAAAMRCAAAIRVIPQAEIDGAGEAVAWFDERGRIVLKEGFVWEGDCVAAGRAIPDNWKPILYAAPAALPEGYVMVPIEPTPKMLEAFISCRKWLDSNDGTKYALRAALDRATGEPYWKAMIAAAQGESRE